MVLIDLFEVYCFLKEMCITFWMRRLCHLESVLMLELYCDFLPFEFFIVVEYYECIIRYAKYWFFSWGCLWFGSICCLGATNKIINSCDFFPLFLNYAGVCFKLMQVSTTVALTWSLRLRLDSSIWGRYEIYNKSVTNLLLVVRI